MSKKTKTIFIITFIIVGLIILGFILLNNKKTNTTGTTTPWYQSFNPFGSGTSTTNNGAVSNEPGETPGTNDINSSRFYKITDFAVAGATFLEDTRPIFYNDAAPQPETVTTTIDASKKEGRKEIQAFLNNALSLNPPLVTDGSFGKLTVQAIKDFQRLKGLTITGTVNTETAPYFTQTSLVSGGIDTRPQYEQIPSVRYVGKINGHIYKMPLDTKVEEKISNGTIPSIQEAFFDKTGNTVIYRYLADDNTISSYMATISEPAGDFLQQDISDLSVSPDKSKLFYLIKNSSGVSGVVKTFGIAGITNVFNYPFTEWLSQWSDNQKIFLTTKASYNVTGSVFLLNTMNKTITKVFGGIKGLTTLVSPNGSLILYNETTGSGPRLGVYDTEKNTTKDLGVYSLPEKCVWSNDNIDIYCALPNVIAGNQYPDYWYQGLVSFDDYFVEINTITGYSTTIANSTKETSVDATKLFLSDTEDTLFFINKKDSTFWGLRVQL